MLQRAVEHVGHDLHVPMPVGVEARAGPHAILVDHAQRAEAHVVGVVIVAEREGVAAVQPAEIGDAALCRRVGQSIMESLQKL